MAKYTNIRMNASSPEAQWWLNQSDRDYAMQVLVQLANQKYGKNKDLKEYSLQKMINSINQNAEPSEKPEEKNATEKAATSEDEQIVEEKSKKSEPFVPDNTPESKKNSTPKSYNAKVDKYHKPQAILDDALFGNGDAQATDKSEQYQAGGFRDKL